MLRKEETSAASRPCSPEERAPQRRIFYSQGRGHFRAQPPPVGAGTAGWGSLAWAASDSEWKQVHGHSWSSTSVLIIPALQLLLEAGADHPAHHGDKTESEERARHSLTKLKTWPACSLSWKYLWKYSLRSASEKPRIATCLGCSVSAGQARNSGPRGDEEGQLGQGFYDQAAQRDLHGRFLFPAEAPGALRVVEGGSEFVKASMMTREAAQSTRARAPGERRAPASSRPGGSRALRSAVPRFISRQLM